MANRTTVKTNIGTDNVPSVSNAILNTLLQNYICDNVKFLDDVAVTQISTVSSITVNFTGKDRVDLTRTGGSLAITVTGLNDGNKKQLLITKTAGQAITFVGVTDVTPVAADVTALATVLYDIVRKGSNYYARAWVGIGAATTDRAGVLETATTTEANGLSLTNKIITPGTIPVASDSQQGIVEKATASEVAALSDTARFVTPGRIPIASTSQRGVVELATQAETSALASGSLAVTPASLQPTAWLTGSLETGWSGTLRYFKDAAGNVHVQGNQITHASITGTSGIAMWAIPLGYRPDQNFRFVVASRTSGAGVVHIVENSLDYLYLVPEPDDYAGAQLTFYIMYREDN